MQWAATWQSWSTKAYSRRSSKKHSLCGDGRIPPSTERGFRRRMTWLDFAGKSARATQKKFVYRQVGGCAVRSERCLAQGIRAWSHWKPDLLVAKARRNKLRLYEETKLLENQNGGSSTVGRVNRRVVAAGRGAARKEAGRASGRVGGRSSPGHDGWRRWRRGGSGSGGREERVHRRPERSGRQ